MQKSKKLLGLASAALILSAFTSCSSSQTLYSWHGYEEAFYQNSKLQTEKTAMTLDKEYAKMFKKQHGIRKTVPPGVNAERGFLLLKDGKIEEAKTFFETEISLYPESEVFISRILKQFEK